MPGETRKGHAMGLAFLFLAAFAVYAYLAFFEIIQDRNWLGGVDILGADRHWLRLFYGVTFVLSLGVSLLFKRKVLPVVIAAIATFAVLSMLEYWARHIEADLHLPVYENTKQYETEWKDAMFWLHTLPFFALWLLSWGISLIIGAIQKARSVD